MKKIITPGVTQKYVNTCGKCMCTYEYEEIDICYGWELGSTNHPYVTCPYCGARNNIWYKTPYTPNPLEYYKITCRGDNQSEQN